MIHFKILKILIFTDSFLAPQNLLYERNHEDREITTNNKSNSNEFLSEKKDISSNKEISNVDNSSIDYYSFDYIEEILSKFKEILIKKRKKNYEKNDIDV